MGLNLKWTRRSFMGSLGALTAAMANPRKLLSFPAGATGSKDHGARFYGKRVRGARDSPP